MPRPRDLIASHRWAGVAVTLFVHAALILAWQMTRSVPPLPQGDEVAFAWIRLPAAAPRSLDVRPVLPVVTPPRAVAPAAPVPPATPLSPTPSAPPPSAAPAEPAPEAPAVPSAAAIMDSARLNVGEIDRALRKERQPTIVLPPDSPQIRLRRGIEHARDMAPPRLWEAPKVEELVNNTGDGARRTRVITGNRTYCITERSPVTSIDMIEKHGRQRITNCPKDEEPARQQVWRTARD